jgi:hypothetical protein
MRNAIKKMIKPKTIPKPKHSHFIGLFFVNAPEMPRVTIATFAHVCTGAIRTLHKGVFPGRTVRRGRRDEEDKSAHALTQKKILSE